jgi:hypothetical protein
MNGKEALALMGIAAVGAGAFHAGLQYDTMASARAQAITIEACGQAYDEPAGQADSSPGDSLNSPVDFATLTDWHGPESGNQEGQEAEAVAVAGTDAALSLEPGHYVVTKQTIKCLENGWVQGGESVDTSNIVAGESEILLKAFAKLEESRGQHFAPASSILWGLGGAAFGLFVAYKIGTYEEREREEAEDDEDAEELEEVRRRGIYDQDRDGYAPEAG